MVVVTPEPGQHARIGKALLALADDPRDVGWVTYPVAGFAVPEELFARFEAEGFAATEPAEPSPPRATEFVDGTQDLGQAKEMRRRGRPPKIKATEEGN